MNGVGMGDGDSRYQKAYRDPGGAAKTLTVEICHGRIAPAVTITMTSSDLTCRPEPWGARQMLLEEKEARMLLKGLKAILDE